MAKTLYTFATSERPDAYINSLAYTVAHKDVTKFNVIVISEHDYKNENESKLWATNVTSKINSQLCALSKREYFDFNKNSNIPLKNIEDLEIYERCLETINRSGMTGKVISIKDLDNILRLYAAKGKCIFDVSALKKNLLVDVVSILLSVNFSEVYSFEIHKKQTYDQEDLYHCLKKSDFVFRNLTVSDPVKLSLRRIKKWSARSKSIILFTFILAAIFILVHLYLPDSKTISILNVAAMVASVGSYLFLLVYDRKS